MLDPGWRHVGADRRHKPIQTIQVWPKNLVAASGGLVIIASMLGVGVVMKDALKQVVVIDTISVPKDLEADGYTPATMVLRSTSRHRKRAFRPSLRGDQLIEKGAIITGE
jgi:hypothetical protein